jgi:hypothetical protein
MHFMEDVWILYFRGNDKKDAIHTSERQTGFRLLTSFPLEGIYVKKSNIE